MYCIWDTNAIETKEQQQQLFTCKVGDGFLPSLEEIDVVELVELNADFQGRLQLATHGQSWCLISGSGP